MEFKDVGPKAFEPDFIQTSKISLSKEPEILPKKKSYKEMNKQERKSHREERRRAKKERKEARASRKKLEKSRKSIASLRKIPSKSPSPDRRSPNQNMVDIESLKKFDFPQEGTDSIFGEQEKE